MTDHASAHRSRLAWHPDGSVLAVPGAEVRHGVVWPVPHPYACTSASMISPSWMPTIQNDIILYERLSWTTIKHLSGSHSKPVNAVSFSPNGTEIDSANGCTAY